MSANTRSIRIVTALALLSAPAAFAAEETTLPGKFTATEEQALYGLAVLRQAPDMDAQPVGRLMAGSKVTVFPDDSPEAWWHIEMRNGDEVVDGYVPRSLVKLNTGPFKDVAKDHWAAPALARLKTSGALTGYKGGFFQGEKPFSRYEMAVLLDRYMGRLKKARERIEERIAEIPMQTHLGGNDAQSLDQVIQKLEKVSREEKELQGILSKLQVQVGQHEERLNGMHAEVASVVHHDKDQDRRLDELAITASKLTAEVAALRAMGKTYAKASTGSSSGGKLNTTIAANIVRVKQLMNRAENLEAKVSALESRDRLARLLRNDEAQRASTSPVLAIRDAVDAVRSGQM